jgi:hypothetical protein
MTSNQPQNILDERGSSGKRIRDMTREELLEHAAECDRRDKDHTRLSEQYSRLAAAKKPAGKRK